MAAMSDYLERKLLDHTLGTAAYTHPSQAYLALHTADPTAACRGLEANVLKYLVLLRQASTSSDEAATPARGMPFPMGLPIVTMSGTKSEVS